MKLLIGVSAATPARTTKVQIETLERLVKTLKKSPQYKTSSSLKERVKEHMKTLKVLQESLAKPVEIRIPHVKKERAAKSTKELKLDEKSSRLAKPFAVPKTANSLQIRNFLKKTYGLIPKTSKADHIWTTHTGMLEDPEKMASLQDHLRTNGWKEEKPKDPAKKDPLKIHVFTEVETDARIITYSNGYVVIKGFRHQPELKTFIRPDQ